jgi:hypothetical protein
LTQINAATGSHALDVILDGTWMSPNIKVVI